MSARGRAIASRLRSFFTRRSSSSSSSDENDDDYVPVPEAGAAEVDADERVCPFEDFRRAFIILAVWAQKMARAVAGENHPKIEAIWLHQILHQAGFCSPFLAAAGNSRQHTRANQEVIHGSVRVPDGPHVTSVRVQARAKDQGWCDNPSAGSWTWGELAWASSKEGQLGPQLSDQRFEVYRNTIEVRGWQDHDVVFEGDRLEALLEAKPASQSSPPLLVFIIRSRFGGWHHTVDRVEVAVEWDGVAESYLT